MTQPDDVKQDIVPDADSSHELEELMHAAGHRYAFVDLRSHGGAWLGGTFVARPMYFRPERAPWREVLDALLFIDTQEPSRRILP